MFSSTDIQQIREHGMTPEVVENQIKRFKTGFPWADITAPATPGHGIHVHSDAEKARYARLFEAAQPELEIIRFIPASGAATRMFKDLFALRERLAPLAADAQQDLLQRDEVGKRFFSELEQYPFYGDLGETSGASPLELIDRILLPGGLNYGALPKGLLKFHRYGKQSRTAFEEHLIESPAFCASGGRVKFHFTVSPEHMNGFREEQDALLPSLEKSTGLQYEINYSTQKPSTDTIAAGSDNAPFRDGQGRLVFRPGGHGALLENLDEAGEGMFFISNIDNVAPERVMPGRIAHKQYLGGVLLEVRDRAHTILKKLHQGSLSAEGRKEALEWMERDLGMEAAGKARQASAADQEKVIMDLLDRPVRVCGMVRNEGEPGGGPFFVRDTEGRETLQIVELSQIDTSDPEKMKIVGGSTHFNPVDLACWMNRYDGSKFKLGSFRDPETGFISHKSLGGRDLKALELPGLWNGSMAGWLTIFVEVSSETFSPVKTVFDLVRPEHQQ